MLVSHRTLTLALALALALTLTLTLTLTLALTLTLTLTLTSPHPRLTPLTLTPAGATASWLYLPISPQQAQHGSWLLSFSPLYVGMLVQTTLPTASRPTHKARRT